MPLRLHNHKQALALGSMAQVLGDGMALALGDGMALALDGK